MLPKCWTTWKYENTHEIKKKIVIKPHPSPSFVAPKISRSLVPIGIWCLIVWKIWHHSPMKWPLKICHHPNNYNFPYENRFDCKNDLRPNRRTSFGQLHSLRISYESIQNQICFYMWRKKNRATEPDDNRDARWLSRSNMFKQVTRIDVWMFEVQRLYEQRFACIENMTG